MLQSLLERTEGGQDIKILAELTVLVGVPQGPALARLHKQRLLGYEGWGVHSCEGSCTPAWHFSYLHCLIVSVDVFMIFSPSLFVCSSFFSTNARLHPPPSLALSFYLSLLSA